MSSTDIDPRRLLPSVDALLRAPELAVLLETQPRGVVTDAVRLVLDGRRRHGTPEPAHVLAAEVAALVRPSLARVINATGVVLHTNLGRAPLAARAIAAAVAAAGSASLEWDAVTGGRGSRHDHVVSHVRALTGAESACVANTNAGGVLLALVALAGGGEVLVSRGQLVEIGGGFRVPDVLAASGCRLVEVGTTNRTRLADYEGALTPATRAILRVHPSNFRVVGFTQETPLGDLAALARDHGLSLIDDVGSGALTDDSAWPDEPDVRTSVTAGSDLVCFSADKLLGGPQAGVLAGTAASVARARSHPLMRALRPDKLTLAALEATLALHRDAESQGEIPVVAMLRTPTEALTGRARELAAATGGRVVPSVGRVGGGTLPLHEVAGAAVALEDRRGADALAAALRAGHTPVAAVVRDGAVLLDVLALTPEDLADLPGLVETARG